MSDIKIFQVRGKDVSELESRSVTVEKSLQDLIEKHLDTFFGIRFLASEYSTGKSHRGRIDTLGIDENGCPVIIEYKRALNENVINQGLFYLVWLQDHKSAFQLLVQEELDKETAANIEWSSPRLLCIAGDFTRYDQQAVKEIDRNIELIRYKRYGDDLMLFELLNVSTSDEDTGKKPEKKKGKDKIASQHYLSRASAQLKDLFEALKSFLMALGDDVQFKVLRYYFAFKRLKNFACVEIKPQVGKIIIHTKINPDTVTLEQGFTRDVRGKGHYGTGDLEISISSEGDLAKAKDLLVKSYEVS